MAEHETITKWIKAIGMLVILMLVGAPICGADENKVKQLNALGTATIHGKNLADGRQNAVNAALDTAVGQVVMELLAGETVVRRFQLINNRILAERDTYVQNYRVLTESISGSTVRTLVQVDVAVDRVSRDLSRLGLALAGVVYPKVLFMVAEKTVTDAGFSFWWGDNRLLRRVICEGAMAAALGKIGFEIIDPPDLNVPLGLPVSASEADMIALAKRFGADVLVSGYGTAAAVPNTMGSTIQAFEAIVEVQAFSIQKSQSIGQTRQKAVVSGKDAVMGGREALSAAGNLAGNELVPQVMASWQREQDRSALIQVVVEGTGGHIASFVRLRTAIASLSGVRELKMNEMSANRAALAVNYQGSTRSLADALLLKTFSGFGIDIFEVTPEAVRIRLVHQ